MNHPGPWSIEEYTTSPPIPCAITCGHPNIHHVLRIGRNAVGRNELQFFDDQAKRLVLSAPEMLAALKRHAKMEVLDPSAMDLIDRIEKGEPVKDV